MMIKTSGRVPHDATMTKSPSINYSKIMLQNELSYQIVPITMGWGHGYPYRVWFLSVHLGPPINSLRRQVSVQTYKLYSEY